MTVGSPGQIPSSTPNPTPTPTNAPPAITLTATPSSLSTAGQGTQLLWAVQNATSCTASGGWSGSKNPQGGNERHTPPQSTVYTLTCQGPGGTSQKSVTVTVGAAGSCSKYSAGATLPAGYGAPWDVTNPGTLLLNADCAPPNILLKVGDNNMLRYIFKNAHIASSGAPSWTAVNLFGSTPASESWYKGSAQGVANIQSLATPAYYLAYTCAWKCGCRDTACTQSYWQIQKLQQ